MCFKKKVNKCQNFKQWGQSTTKLSLLIRKQGISSTSAHLWGHHTSGALTVSVSSDHNFFLKKGLGGGSLKSMSAFRSNRLYPRPHTPSCSKKGTGTARQWCCALSHEPEGGLKGRGAFRGCEAPSYVGPTCLTLQPMTSHSAWSGHTGKGAGCFCRASWRVHHSLKCLLLLPRDRQSLN